MRRCFYIILSSLLLLAGCSRAKTVPGYERWRTSGNAGFDSLTAIVLDCHTQAFDTSESIIPQMEKIARADSNNRIMQARLDIFRYSHGYNESSTASRLAMLGHAMSLVDSAQYPQDYYYGITEASHSINTAA